MKKQIFALIGILCSLALAVTATIGLAWLLYPLEITWLGIERLTGLSQERLVLNFNHLMAYLTLPWVSELNMPDFPSSVSGLKHFADVKRLFHLTQVLLLLTLFPTLAWLKQHHKQLAAYRQTLVVLVIAPFVMALLGVLTGFDSFFVLFHQLLFPGDHSWLFDPATDPVINSLPATFFLHHFLIFGGIYEAINLCLLGLTCKLRKDVQ